MSTTIAKMGFVPYTCPGELGRGSVYVEPCDISVLKKVRRILFMRRNGVNPFTTVADTLIEANMNAWLSLTDAADAPDNVHYTPDLWEITKAPGAANIITSNSNQPDVTNYGDAIVTFSFANLNPDDENDLAVTIRSNKKNLQVYFVTEDNELVYRAISNLTTEVPSFIPLKLATLQDKSSDGIANNELNTGTMYIRSDDNFNWRKVALPYSLLTKIQ
jgi:hypothetical protein